MNLAVHVYILWKRHPQSALKHMADPAAYDKVYSVSCEDIAVLCIANQHEGLEWIVRLEGFTSLIHR